jgi:hypothetical protein
LIAIAARGRQTASTSSNAHAARGRRTASTRYIARSQIDVMKYRADMKAKYPFFANLLLDNNNNIVSTAEVTAFNNNIK